jgi:hypothetical protein
MHDLVAAGGPNPRGERPIADPHTPLQCFAARSRVAVADHASRDVSINPKQAAFTQRRKDAKIFQSLSSAMPFT